MGTQRLRSDQLSDEEILLKIFGPGFLPLAGHHTDKMQPMHFYQSDFDSSQFNEFTGDDAYPGGSWSGPGRAGPSCTDLSPVHHQPPVQPLRPVVPAPSPPDSTAYTPATSVYIPALNTASPGANSAPCSSNLLTLSTCDNSGVTSTNPQYGNPHHHQLAGLPSVETIFSGPGNGGHGNATLSQSARGPQGFLEGGEQHHHLETTCSSDPHQHHHHHIPQTGDAGNPDMIQSFSQQPYSHHHHHPHTNPGSYYQTDPSSHNLDTYNLDNASLSLRVKPEPGDQLSPGFESPRQQQQYPPSSWGSPSSSESQLTGVGESDLCPPGGGGGEGGAGCGGLAPYPSTSSATGGGALTDLASPSTSYTATTQPKKAHPRQGYRRASDGDPRKERRREQNRRAALKCRVKKKKEWDEVQKDFNRLESSNAEMQEKIDKLRREKQELCNLLREHKQSCSLEVELPPPSP